jgi:hypothetical protein
MANNFKNFFSKSVGTSAASVYTCPSSTQTTIIGMTVANINTAAITVDVYITSGGVDYYLVKGATVPLGGALVPVGGDQKVCLEPADVLKVVSSTSSSADVVLSLLEIA